MIDQIVFTPPTLLSTTPSSSASAGLTLHSTTSTRQISRAEGVMGSPAPRDVTRTAPGRDGVIEDTKWLNDRVIVLEGEIWGTSQRAVLDDWATLNSAFEATMLAQGQLTVTLPAASGGSTQQRWCKVTLASPAQVSLEGGSNYLAYQVSFRAADPRWYGITLNTSSTTVTGGTGTASATISNAGTAPTMPKFTFAGSDSVALLQVDVPTAYSTLSPQGASINLAPGSGGVFNVNSSSYIDCSIKKAVFSSGSISATTEWPILYPGSSTWTWGSASPSGNHTTTLSWYDAWW